MLLLEMKKYSLYTPVKPLSEFKKNEIKSHWMDACYDSVADEPQLS